MGDYRFEITCSIDIQADSIEQAIGMLKERHSDAYIKNVKKDGVPLAHTFSGKTGRTIYYRPGCPHGETDCILDPMRDVAASCAQQADMTDDKYVPCHEEDVDSDSCPYYDDECK